MRRLTPTEDNTEQVWDTYYEVNADEERNYGDKPYQLLRWIEGNDTLVDIGTGNAGLPRLMKQVRPNIEISVSDYSHTGLDGIRLTDHDFVEVFYGDIYNLDLGDGAYDVVMCCQVLEHLESPADAVAELARVARRKVLITVPYQERIVDSQHVWAFSLDDMNDLLEPYGQVHLSMINGTSNILAVVVRR